MSPCKEAQKSPKLRAFPSACRQITFFHGQLAPEKRGSHLEEGIKRAFPASCSSVYTIVVVKGQRAKISTG